MNDDREFACPECHTPLQDELIHKLRNSIPVYCEFCGIALTEHFNKAQILQQKVFVDLSPNQSAIPKRNDKSGSFHQKMHEKQKKFQQKWEQKQIKIQQKMAELQNKWNSRIREYNQKLRARLQKLNEKLKAKLQQIKAKFQTRRKQAKNRRIKGSPLQYSQMVASTNQIITHIKIFDKATQEEFQPKFDIFTGLPLINTAQPIQMPIYPPTQAINESKKMERMPDLQAEHMIDMPVSEPTEQNIFVDIREITAFREKEERLARERAHFDPETGLPLSQSLRKTEKPNIFTVLEPTIRMRIMSLDIPEKEKDVIAKTFIYLPPERQAQYLDLLEGQDLNVTQREQELIQMLQNLPLSNGEKQVLLNQFDYLTESEQERYLAELHKTSVENRLTQNPTPNLEILQNYGEKITIKNEIVETPPEKTMSRSESAPTLPKKQKKVLLTD